MTDLLPFGSVQPAIERLVREDPTSFEFSQLVRLLQKMRPGRTPVGRFGDPRGELARFGANTSIAFPASEVQALRLEDETVPAAMTVNFIGLSGPLGVMPLTYSLMIAERERAKDLAPRAFVDMFNHRLTSLYYRAWEKYRFTVAHERGEGDPLMRHLRDLVGVGTDELRERLPVPDETLVYYAGLLAPQSRPAAALEQLLTDYFQVPAVVEQFVGGWYPIERSTQCELGDELTVSTQLGLGAVAGDEIWDQQARIRVRLGPLTRAQYDRFLPTGDAYDPLQALLRFFGNDQFDFDLQLVLDRDEAPEVILGADESAATPLGWCSWLKTAPLDRDPDETVLTLGAPL